jgi:hypothetical protein
MTKKSKSNVRTQGRPGRENSRKGKGRLPADAVKVRECLGQLVREGQHPDDAQFIAVVPVPTAVIVERTGLDEERVLVAIQALYGFYNR